MGLRVPSQSIYFGFGFGLELTRGKDIRSAGVKGFTGGQMVKEKVRRYRGMLRNDDDPGKSLTFVE